MRWWLRAWVLLLPVACAGLLGSDPAARVVREDAGDEAVSALAAGDFTGAEAILQRRLRADPNDARSWRILGDLNLLRGQRFQERWKENLGWATDAYLSAVKLDPTRCPAWGRLAVVLIAAGDEGVPRAKLDELPFARGWEACPGGVALLEVEWRRRPTEAELAAAEGSLSGEPSASERLAVAAPWMVDAVRKADLGAVSWSPSLTRPEIVAGTPFVVLEVPTTGDGVGGSQPRRFTYPEQVTVSRVAGARIVYLDSRFPARVPETAVTRAPGCPGTTWELQGIDRVPVGTCRAGPQDRRASELFDPGILKPAGVAHYHEPSIRLAKIAWDSVADESVTCRGGPVGRLFVDTPSCEVTYDRAVSQTRSLEVASGIAAASPEHAARMVDAARGERLFGAAAGPIARGEVGIGMPFAWFAWSQPDLPGCRARGVFNRVQIVDGVVGFDCTVQGTRYRFRELALVGTEPAAGE